MPAIHHRTISVSDLNVFVREAGEPDRPALVLLHGFPSSSRQYVRLIDRLAGHWHVIAPDYPGFGLSDPVPDSPPSTASPKSPPAPSTRSASTGTPCTFSTSARRSGSASPWPTTGGSSR